MNVGGRLGAAEGPKAFLRCFERLKGRDGVQEALAAKVEVTGLGKDVKENHRRAADLIRDAHRSYPLSVVVGGGHDHGYSHLLGLAQGLPHAGGGKLRLGCINIDAHFDVRKPSPEISSGSPFYLAIEAGILDPALFIEFGIQRHCNAKELWDYIEQKKVEVVPYETLRRDRAVPVFEGKLLELSARCDVVAISLDLDAAAAAYAPGVSAPQAEGFSSSEIIEMMEIAGRNQKVASLGIFELNPVHDLDDRTARLGATSAYHFISAAIGLGT